MEKKEDGKKETQKQEKEKEGKGDLGGQGMFQNI